MEQIATEGIFAFFNIVLHRECPKKVPRRKNSNHFFIAIFQNGANSSYIYLLLNSIFYLNYI